MAAGKRVGSRSHVSPPTSSPALPSSSPVTRRPVSWLRTAESCTGGLIAALLTEIPGSSTVLERGFVVYSNAAKQELLGVPAETLASHGAVSGETARAMAEGALRASRGEVAVSVTGIAGPDGGSAEKAGRPRPFRLRPAREADSRARGAVRRHRPGGRTARLGQGRPRFARGGGGRRLEHLLLDRGVAALMPIQTLYTCSYRLARASTHSRGRGTKRGLKRLKTLGARN